VGQSLGSIVSMHHVPTPVELTHLVDAVGFGLFLAALAGVFYLGLEPLVRRRWPQTLISWTRLLAGDARDPLVGAHILLGVTFGVALAVFLNGMDWYRFETDGVVALHLNRLGNLHVTDIVSMLLTGLIQPAAIVIGGLFFFVVLRLVLRSTWAATATAIALSAVISTAAGGAAPAALVSGAVIVSMQLWVTIRFGILPATVLLLFGTEGQMPLTSDLSAWYASRGLFVVALALALAIWGFRHALAGRRVLSENFLEA
jgi:serine/threonine-protein kinase